MSVQIAKGFILSAPPGEVKDVVKGMMFLQAFSYHHRIMQASTSALLFDSICQINLSNQHVDAPQMFRFCWEARMLCVSTCRIS
jgi:hypothetical protein